MNRKRLIISICILVAGIVFTAFYPGVRHFIPSQQVELSHGVQYGAVLKDFLFVQEITMKKRYLSRVDIYMAKLPSPVTNNNVFVLIDNQGKILYTKRFNSSDFGEALHFPFSFGKSFDIGKGNKVNACIYSIDGDQQSYIGLARKDGSQLGKLYVIPIIQGDVQQSFVNKQSVVDFPGTLGVRTYESESTGFSLFQIILYLLTITLSAFIFFWPVLHTWLIHHPLKPEAVYISVSFFFGLVMMIITPPFQVPDEPVHLYRAWQISEFNLLKLKDDMPKALAEFGDTCRRMNFSTHEKTSVKEIRSMASIKIDPGQRTFRESTNYIIPYLPQAIGIGIGRLLHLDLLWIFYLGRLMNLIASIILVIIAIRIIPVFKWLFTMAGLLPMTLYQFASLSYDAGTIGLSFILLALILRLAFYEGADIKRLLVWIFIISALLATSKPPYFLIALAFLIVPVAKIGSIRRYAISFSVLIIMSLMVSQMWAPVRRIADGISDVPGMKEHRTLFFPVNNPFKKLAGIHQSMLGFSRMVPALATGGAWTGHFSDVNDETTDGDETTSQTVPVTTTQNPVNAGDQVRFILANPLEYMGILAATLKTSGNLYMVSLIGLFGWIDTQIPDLLAYINLIFLILLAMMLPVDKIKLSLKQKLVLLSTFLVCFILIETALYLYCNPVGSNHIIAVQGRYFIAVVPLLFMIFYRNEPLRWPFRKTTSDQGKLKNQKPKQAKPREFSETEHGTLITIIPFVVLILSLVNLFWSVYLIVDRFYVIYL
jgi:uncharacterized membrane protein